MAADAISIRMPAATEQKTMERIAAFALSTRTLAGAAMAAQPEKPTGLCAATEQSYFSCRTTRSRWIGLCGNSPRQLHYRF